MSNLFQGIKGFYFAALAAMIFLLAGCLPSDVNMKPPITDKTPINNDGIVVATVINAGGSSLPFNQLTLTPKNINVSKGNKYPRLVSLNDPDGNTSLFASAIPPGEYTVESIRSFFVIGEYFYSLWATGGVDLGVFSVAPGKVTDLGTFIYYRKVEGEKYSDKLIRIPQTNNQELIKHYRPFIKYSPTEVLTWNEDGSDTERFSTYVSLSQNPTLFSARHMSDGGSLFLTGKLGTILERIPNGEWKQETLDTNADLRAIDTDHKGQLLVGGDQGALYLRDENAQWQDLSLDIGTEVTSIQFLSSGEAAIYTVQNGNGVILHGDLNKGIPEWKKVYSYRVSKGWVDVNDQILNTGEPAFRPPKTWQRVESLRVENFLGQEYVRVGIKKASNGKTFTVIDSVDYKLFKLSSDNKIIYEPNALGRMDGIMDAGKTSIGIDIAGFWSWTGKDSFHRYDANSDSWVKIKTYINNCPKAKNKVRRCTVNGQSMKRIEDFDFIATPVFVSPEKGYASVRSIDIDPEQRKSYLLSTTDGGDTWKKLNVEFPAKFCTDIVPEIDDRIMLYCAGVSGDFYESTDEGKTWKHVRQHQYF
ncbi:hypothetical protein [Cellvibrio sp. PSBB006]|uniref:WD40/YVTN/BNR-like repeat-containing protein n=1 Tax=Cellvibrio sp. PSBB006 TaxID=1987723 RepID=UPI000B3B1325|nr:hypothetical protein [Cellvibrio sp. PSBB006]ARU28209.1 hypothetical protein CBR65_12660 [Cellvibrio sp. PSBB006]